MLGYPIDIIRVYAGALQAEIEPVDDSSAEGDAAPPAEPPAGAAANT